MRRAYPRGAQGRSEPVILPHGFTPRSYQLPFWRRMASGCKRAIPIWHRKAGKDVVTWNFTIAAAVQRAGLYLYCFPDGVQARQTIWDGFTSDGRAFRDFVPPALLAEKPNETEMSLRLHAQGGGTSILQLRGTDNFERLRGPNPVGIVFSEYPYAAPQAWETLAPILLANDGWAVFPMTPAGRNHGWDLYQNAVNDPSWFAEVLTVEQTHKDAPGEDGSLVITPEAIEAERLRGVDENFIQQEYFCDFSGSRVGAYYAEPLRRAREEGRVSAVPWDPALACETWWDLGVGENMAVWIVQHRGARVCVIDFLAGVEREWIPEMARRLQQKPYVYDSHFLPHDAAGTDPGAEGTRRAQAEALLRGEVVVVEKWSVADGIAAASALLARCWFDEDKCAAGLKALASYRREFDDKHRTYKDTPVKDWASHPADAFRYGAVGSRGGSSRLLGSPITVESSFDPRVMFGGLSA